MKLFTFASNLCLCATTTREFHIFIDGVFFFFFVFFPPFERDFYEWKRFTFGSRLTRRKTTSSDNLRMYVCLFCSCLLQLLIKTIRNLLSLSVRNSSHSASSHFCQWNFLMNEKVLAVTGWAIKAVQWPDYVSSASNWCLCKWDDVEMSPNTMSKASNAISFEEKPWKWMSDAWMGLKFHIHSFIHLFVPKKLQSFRLNFRLFRLVLPFIKRHSCLTRCLLQTSGIAD